MNLANRLTMARIILVPFLIIFMHINNFWARIAALLIFIAASITDVYDGIIARRLKKITTLGIFLDPLADKLIISAALISFVSLRELNIPAWMVVFIISREYIITGLRSLAAAEKVIISASSAGKFKTTSQIVTIIITMIIMIINSWFRNYRGISPGELTEYNGLKFALGLALNNLPFILMFITTILTMISGFSYLVKHKDIFREK
jgi:CDP-diacylglycerol---glycerol-3-phosphate 3-phosphatidyltransferase